jgi:hypothetical protein
MPQQRLQFLRTVVTRSIRTASTQDNASNSSTPLAESSNPSPASSAPLTPTPTLIQPKEKIRTSWIFRHIPDEDMQTKYLNPDSGYEEWRCYYCEKTYLTSGSTSGPARHLTQYHKIPDGSARGIRAMNVQKSLHQAFAQADANPAKRRRLDSETIHQDKLEALWVRAVVSCNLSFRLVENPEFRAFISYLNNKAKELLAQDHTQVRRWILHQYKGLKDQVKATLRKARSKIHISCDL